MSEEAEDLYDLFQIEVETTPNVEKVKTMIDTRVGTDDYHRFLSYKNVIPIINDVLRRPSCRLGRQPC